MQIYLPPCLFHLFWWCLCAILGTGFLVSASSLLWFIISTQPRRVFIYSSLLSVTIMFPPLLIDAIQCLQGFRWTFVLRNHRVTNLSQLCLFFAALVTFFFVVTEDRWWPIVIPMWNSSRSLVLSVLRQTFISLVSFIGQIYMVKKVEFLRVQRCSN